MSVAALVHQLADLSLEELEIVRAAIDSCLLKRNTKLSVALDELIGHSCDTDPLTEEVDDCERKNVTKESLDRELDEYFTTF
jgi:predicted ribosome quality control (RQC) complex YloA/Tae2 family protein